MIRNISAVLAVAALGVLNPAQAAEKYPERVVRVVVPYPPGGITDIIGRLMADRMRARLGQTFIVDNRPGAGGLVGSDAVAKSPPDGYTLLVGSIANTTIPAINPNVPYDLKRDLVPICHVISVPNFLVVGTSSPYKSVQDLISAARAQPNKLSFASTGPGASPHLSSELFKIMTKTDIVHVPHKGSGPAQIDLMAGRIDMMFDNGALSQVQGGTLRALAVSSPKRSAALPDVPTVAEAGVPGFAVTSWYGIWAPAGTPAPILALLEKEVSETFREPAVKEKLLSHGGETEILCGKDFATHIDAELAKWSKLVKEAGLQASN